VSKRQYPFIYGRKKLTQFVDHGAPVVCTKCDTRALYRCEIQYNWFRGDDEYEARCEAHSKQPSPVIALTEKAAK